MSLRDSRRRTKSGKTVALGGRGGSHTRLYTLAKHMFLAALLVSCCEWFGHVNSCWVFIDSVAYSASRSV